MNYYAGLDVSLEETAICVVDEQGRIVRELRAVAIRRRLSQPFKALACRWSA